MRGCGPKVFMGFKTVGLFIRIYTPNMLGFSVERDSFSVGPSFCGLVDFGGLKGWLAVRYVYFSIRVLCIHGWWGRVWKME